MITLADAHPLGYVLRTEVDGSFVEIYVARPAPMITLADSHPQDKLSRLLCFVTTRGHGMKLEASREKKLRLGLYA